MEGDKNVEQVCESFSMVQPGDKLCSGFSLQQSNSCYEGTSSYSDESHEHCNSNVDVEDNASIISKVVINGKQKCSLLFPSSQIKLHLLHKTVFFHWLSFTEYSYWQ